MSKYTDYDDVSQNYDDGRICDGVDMMTSVLVGILGKKAEDIHILEAGCGTGNYSLGFLQNGIGKLTMVDASSGMLHKAKCKVQSYGNRVLEVRKHKLPSLPFSDESFDVVTLIQVVHHLDTCHLEEGCTHGEDVDISDGGTAANEKNRISEPISRFGYPNLEITCREAYRVLKPGGVLLIDHCFHSNLEASWLSLTPKALALIKLAYISEGSLIELLKEEKFVNPFFVQRPDSQILRATLANNIEGILDKKWRKLDSGWSFVERSGELPGIIQLVTDKKSDSKLEEFVYDLNTQQRIVGSHTTLFCQKPTD